MAEMYLPNAANWIDAFNAGQDVSMTRKKRDATTQAAGFMAKGDYAGAAQAILPYDPSAGLALTKEAEAQKAKTRKTEIRKAYQDDPQAGLSQALEYDDDLYKDLKGIDDAATLKKAKEWGGMLRGVASLPEDQWDDEILANRGRLEALGIPAQEIDGFISAPPQTRRVMMSAMLSRADMLDSYYKDQDSAADNARADAAQTETERQHRVSERQGDARIGLSRQQLGVAQAGLGLRREQHEARLKGQGGYGRPVMGGGDMSQMSDDELESLLNEGQN